MTLNRERARQLIVEHELDFSDLCALVLAYSEKCDGMLKWTGPRVVVHIERAKRQGGKRS